LKTRRYKSANKTIFIYHFIYLFIYLKPGSWVDTNTDIKYNNRWETHRHYLFHYFSTYYYLYWQT